MFYAKRRESPDAYNGCLAKELAGRRRTESQDNQQPGSDISEIGISERLTQFRPEARFVVLRPSAGRLPDFAAKIRSEDLDRAAHFV
jgi:hypothetical protein